MAMTLRAFVTGASRRPTCAVLSFFCNSESPVPGAGVMSSAPFAPWAAQVEGIAPPSASDPTLSDARPYAAPAAFGAFASTPLPTAGSAHSATPGAAVAPAAPPQPAASPARTATLMVLAFAIGGVVVAGGLVTGLVLLRPAGSSGASGFTGMNPLPSELSGRFDPAERIDFVRRRVAAKRPAPRLLGINVSTRTHDGLLAVANVEDSVQYIFGTSATDCPWLIVTFGAGSTWDACPAGAPTSPPIPDPKCTTQGAMRAITRKLGGAPMASSFNYLVTPRGPRWLVQVGLASFTVDGATCAVAPPD